MRKKRGLRQAAANPAGTMHPAPPVRSPAARARSCRGRRVPAPTARAVRPHQPRNPHHASVSSALAARREASALWAVGPKAQSDPKRTEGKRQPGGLLRAAQSDPQVRRKEACALWALGPKAQSDLEA